MISRTESRRRIALAVRITLAAVAVWFVGTRVDFAAIVAAARSAEPVWIVLAVALLPVNLSLESMTWLPVVRSVARKATRGEALTAVLSGYPLGLFTPGRLGELAGRALSLREGDPAQIALTAIVSRLADLAAVLLAGTLALGGAILYGGLRFAGAVPLLLISAASLLLVATALFAPSVLYRLGTRIPPLRRYEPKVRFLTRLTRRRMGKVFFVALTRLAVYTSQFVCLAFAFAGDIQAVHAVLAVLLTFLVKSVIPPITFLDLGVREGAAAFFFGRLGLGAAAGFNAALMLFFINLVLPALAGLPLISRFRIFAPVRRPDRTSADAAT